MKKVLALILFMAVTAEAQIIGNFTANKIVGGRKPTGCAAGPPADVWVDTTVTPPVLNVCGPSNTWNAVGAGATSITGTGTANQVAFFTAAHTIGGSASFTWTPGTSTASIVGTVAISASTPNIGADMLTITLSTTSAITLGNQHRNSIGQTTFESIIGQLNHGTVSQTIPLGSLMQFVADPTSTRRQTGLQISLDTTAGYNDNQPMYTVAVYPQTGSLGDNVGIYVDNDGGTSGANNLGSNYGIQAFSKDGSIVSMAGYFAAQGATHPSPIHQGIAALASNGMLNNAAYFAITNATTTNITESAVIIAEASTSGTPIFLGKRNNGTTAFTIGNSGNVTVNAPSGFVNNLADFQVNSTSRVLFAGSTNELAKFNNTTTGYIGFYDNGTARGYVGHGSDLGAGVSMGIRAETSLQLLIGSTTYFSITSGGTGTYSGSLGAITFATSGGKAIISTGAPTCSGAGCALGAAAQNSSGKVTTTTTGAADITITFSVAFANAPACAASNETTANLLRAISTTTTVHLIGVTVNGDSLAWTCVGH